MSTEIVKANASTVMGDLQNTHQLCQMLLKTPHYAKMGPEGVFAIVETAKSLDIDPRQALSGGLYYVKGKVEMSARMMNSLIRAQKHSITRDRKSDDTICILHGKRADNGDTWTESFSMQDAQRAGLLGNAVWKNFARDMLFARALSRLARQLFPDIIGNVYVEGEIAFDPNIASRAAEATYEPEQEVKAIESRGISSQEAEQLDAIIADDEEYRQSVLKFLVKQCNAKTLYEMPREIYEKVLARALKNQKDREAKRNMYAEEFDQYGEVSQMAGV